MPPGQESTSRREKAILGSGATYEENINEPVEEPEPAGNGSPWERA